MSDKIEDAVILEQETEQQSEQMPATQTGLFDLMLAGQIDKIIKDYPDYDVLGFLRHLIEDKTFGKKGIYTFYCKKCGGSFSFSNKTDRALFERVHKLTECPLEWTLSIVDDGKNKKRNKKARKKDKPADLKPEEQQKQWHKRSDRNRLVTPEVENALSMTVLRIVPAA